jgi:hypothetical protein
MDFPAKWYADANKKRTAKDKPKKAHWEVKHRLPTQLKTNLSWCPRLCQQKPNGAKGKKTFNGMECSECGYKKQHDPKHPP